MQLHLRLITPLALSFASFEIAHAQCGNWTNTFASTGADDRVLALTDWDDGSGSGPVLCAAGLFDSAGGVTLDGIGRWSPASGWTALGGATQNARTLFTAQLPGDPHARLYCGGAFHSIGGVVARGIARHDGTTWSALGTGLVNGSSFPDPFANAVWALTTFDDGAGTKLYAGGDFDAPIGGTSDVAMFDGVSWSPVGVLHGRVFALATYDDGGGPQLYAAGDFSSFGHIARFDGVAWSALPGGMPILNGGPGGMVFSLAVHDDGSGSALFAGGEFGATIGAVGRFVASWRNTGWTETGGGMDARVNTLRVLDDGSGPALFAGGDFTSAGGVANTRFVARWDGASWRSVGGGFDAAPSTAAVVALCNVVDANTGDRALFAGGEFQSVGGEPNQNVALYATCEGAAFCAGDGTLADHTTPCPCGNEGQMGRGCGHSFDAGGASLGTTGTAAHDSVVLHAAHTPASSFTLFLQHDSAGDTLFHDGVLCASGQLVRLRGRAAVAGQARFPNSDFAQDATTTLSQRGGVTPGQGAQRYYSAWYRNASSTFCPPATANVTNGWTLIW